MKLDTVKIFGVILELNHPANSQVTTATAEGHNTTVSSSCYRSMIIIIIIIITGSYLAHFHTVQRAI